MTEVRALERQQRVMSPSCPRGGNPGSARPRHSPLGPATCRLHCALTFSTAWMCSCRSASIILSTYHLSTLMRSLKQRQTDAQGPTRNQMPTNRRVYHEEASFPISAPLFLPNCYKMVTLPSLHINITAPFSELKGEATRAPYATPRHLGTSHPPCRFWRCFHTGGHQSRARTRAREGPGRAAATARPGQLRSGVSSP